MTLSERRTFWLHFKAIFLRKISLFQRYRGEERFQVLSIQCRQYYNRRFLSYDIYHNLNIKKKLNYGVFKSYFHLRTEKKTRLRSFDLFPDNIVKVLHIPYSRKTSLGLTKRSKHLPKQNASQIKERLYVGLDDGKIMFTDIDSIVSSISSSDASSKKWRETMKWTPVKIEWDTQSGPIEQLKVENIQNRYTQVFALRGGSVVMKLDDLTVMVNKDHHALFFTVGHAVYIVTKNRRAIYVHDRTTGHFVRKMDNAVIDKIGRTSTRFGIVSSPLNLFLGG